MDDKQSEYPNEIMQQAFKVVTQIVGPKDLTIILKGRDWFQLDMLLEHVLPRLKPEARAVLEPIAKAVKQQINLNAQKVLMETTQAYEKFVTAEGQSAEAEPTQDTSEQPEDYNKPDDNPAEMDDYDA